MAPSQSTLRYLLFGGLLSIPLLFGLYYWFGGKKAPSKAIKDAEVKKSPPSSSEKKVVESPKKTEQKQQTQVTVEDESDEESDGEEEKPNESANDQKELIQEVNPKVAEQAALKEKYDTCIRLSGKFINGQMHDKAVEQLSEAINLAGKIDCKQSELVKLYNNRSAMYEKLSKFDESIRDIKVLFSLEANHEKGRLRRARIYEQKGKIMESLHDYFYAINWDRIQGKENADAAVKAEKLVKSAAMERSKKIILEMLSTNPPVKPFPSKEYCKNFLESFPEIHRYRSNPESFAASDSEIDQTIVAVYAQFVEDKYSEGFQLLHSLDEVVTAEHVSSHALAHYYDLLGTEAHILGKAHDAFELYNKAIVTNPENMSSHLKYAMLALDFGKVKEAAEKYEELLATIDNIADEATRVLNHAWFQLHRASLWVCKNDTGGYNADAVIASTRDLDHAINATESLVGEDEQAKAIYVSSILKKMHIVTHVSAMMGNMPTPEAQEQIKEDLKKVKKLAPQNGSVIIIDANSMNEEGNYDAALQIIDDAMKNQYVEKSSALTVKGSILTTKFIVAISNAPQYAHGPIYEEHFPIINKTFEEALEADPNSVEVLCQFAQTKQMLSDIETACELLRKALNLARNREEAIDIAGLLVLNEVNLNAAMELRKNLMAAQQG